MPTISRRLVALLALAAFAVAFAVGRLVHPGQAPTVASAAFAPPVAPVPTSASDLVVVDVVGAVRHPGVYHVPQGSRVEEAVRLAGGPTRRAWLEAVNLAARVVDGQQVVVPRSGAGVPGSPAPAPGIPAGPISLSLADEAILDGLPGIGPATAARIVAWRTAHGPFRTVDDLLDVPGIGPAKLAAMRERLVP